MESVLPPHLLRAALELSRYFVDSFGNATRIDYGTGKPPLACLPKGRFELQAATDPHRAVLLAVWTRTLTDCDGAHSCLADTRRA
jgi:hypothetical protein